jgi:hypothetical protein
MFGDDWKDENNRPDESRPPAPPPDAGIARALWTAFAVLVVTLAVLIGYGYHTLKQNRIQLTRVPAMLQSEAVQDGRLEGVEARIQEWSNRWNELRERVNRIDQKATRGIRSARKHSEDLVAEMDEQLQAQIDAQQYLADTRFEKLESAQESDKTRVAQLESELAAMRQELAAYREDTGRELTGLEQRVDGNNHSLASLAQWIPQDRVDFEASKQRDTELLPGVSMTVTGTNVSHQRFKGWVRLIPEGRTLWVNQQGILQPVVFYRQQDGGRCELVVTHVAQNSVAGYLLVPAGTPANNPLAQLDAPRSGGH